MRLSMACAETGTSRLRRFSPARPPPAAALTTLLNSVRRPGGSIGGRPPAKIYVCKGLSHACPMAAVGRLPVRRHPCVELGCHAGLFCPAWDTAVRFD